MIVLSSQRSIDISLLLKSFLILNEKNKDVYQNAKRARAQLTSVQNAAQRRQTGFSMPRHVDAEMGTMMTLHPISKAAKVLDHIILLTNFFFPRRCIQNCQTSALT